MCENNKVAAALLPLHPLFVKPHGGSLPPEGGVSRGRGRRWKNAISSLSPDPLRRFGFIFHPVSSGLQLITAALHHTVSQSPSVLGRGVGGGCCLTEGVRWSAKEMTPVPPYLGEQTEPELVSWKWTIISHDSVTLTPFSIQLQTEGVVPSFYPHDYQTDACGQSEPSSRPQELYRMLMTHISLCYMPIARNERNHRGEGRPPLRSASSV